MNIQQYLQQDNTSPSASSSSASTVSSLLKKYKQQMKFKNAPGGEASRPPWSQILGTWMLWVTTLQAMGQAWSGVMMILMVKEYLEEIHGYSLQEAAIMVTIPNNLTQFFLGLCVGYLGDLLIKKKVAARTVRRLGSGIQILACLPLLLLPFLPCSWIEYRASMVVIQVGEEEEEEEQGDGDSFFPRAWPASECSVTLRATHPTGTSRPPSTGTCSGLRHSLWCL